MKTLTLAFSLLLLTNATLFAQSGMTIKSGGAVTVNGNLTITPAPFVCGNPMTDIRDGKTYNTVLIGTRCWMAQNLNLGTRVNGTAEQTDNNVIEKYCYADQESYCDIYGGFYQWGEAMQYSIIEGAKGICPESWHMPYESDWTSLATSLGGMDVAGGKMKEAGTSRWSSPNTGGTNSSGFTALPSGYRAENIGWGQPGNYTYFWSSWSPLPTVGAGTYYLSFYYENLTQGNYASDIGFSVRCVKD